MIVFTTRRTQSLINVRHICGKIVFVLSCLNIIPSQSPRTHFRTMWNWNKNDVNLCGTAMCRYISKGFVNRKEVPLIINCSNILTIKMLQQQQKNKHIKRIIYANLNVKWRCSLLVVSIFDYHIGNYSVAIDIHTVIVVVL